MDVSQNITRDTRQEIRKKGHTQILTGTSFSILLTPKQCL